VTGWFFEPRLLTLRLDGARRAEHRAARAAASASTGSYSAARSCRSTFERAASSSARPSSPASTARASRCATVACSRVADGNVVVEGLWGFTEDDGTPTGRTPPAIRRATMLLVLRSMAPLADDASFEARSRWRIIEERTRDQSYRLDPSKQPARRASPATRDRRAPCALREAHAPRSGVMRGRLIFPFIAELHRLDTQAMAPVDYDAPPAATTTTSRSRSSSTPTTMASGALSSRAPPVRVPCQVEPEAFEALRMATSGNTPRSSFDLVFHFRDLERLGLVDAASGDALIRPSDRLGALYARDGQLVQAVRTPPGLYVTEARPIGFGLHRRRPEPQPPARVLPGPRSRTEWNMMRALIFSALASPCASARTAVRSTTACWARRGAQATSRRSATRTAAYHELADCDLVSEQSGAPFVCAFVDETTEDGRVTGHTCVPAADADAAAGGSDR
jgi:hypothetical protein